MSPDPVSTSSAERNHKPVGRTIARALAGRTVFAFMVLLAVVVSGWLVWTHAFTVVRTEAGLPPGIPAQAPALNQADVETIRQARSERVNYQPRSYSRFVSIFRADDTTQP